MEGSWLLQLDWLDLLEIFGDLMAPAISVVVAFEARRIARESNHFIRAQNHGNYWMGLVEKPEFSSILDLKRNVTTTPITAKEEVFVGVRFLDFQRDFVASKHGLSTLPANIDKDIQAYFSFPVVVEVWKKRREFLEPEFVSFVEDAFKSKLVHMPPPSPREQRKAA